MASFEQAIKGTFKAEGGFQNHFDDNAVRYNNIQADVQSKTFLYTATAITQFWTKRIINGSDGNIYLEYFDGLLLTYVDPLTA